MRGTLSVVLEHSTSTRIIHADAGNTAYTPYSALLHWDHPRGCGEHLVDELNGLRDGGSSPRMREYVLCTMTH